MTLLLAANRGRIDEQDRESPEVLTGSYMREYETQSIIGLILIISFSSIYLQIFDVGGRILYI